MRHGLVAGFAALIFLFAGCGDSGSARDDAVGALEQATEAAALESEMSGLVADLSSNPSPAEREELESKLADLDQQAEDLIDSADQDSGLEDDIVAAVEDTRAAGEQLSSGGGSSESRNRAIERLKRSNQRLRASAGVIEADLEDAGGTATTDLAEIDGLVAQLDASAETLASAAEPVSCQVPDAFVLIKAQGVACPEAVRLFTDYANSAFKQEPPGFTCRQGASIFETICEAEDGRRLRWSQD